jgi:ankyrin repeat protein
VALAHALKKGTHPDLKDSDGATPLHVINGNNDNVNPEMVRSLVRAGGAEVTDRHRELAAGPGASQVEAALRR